MKQIFFVLLISSFPFSIFAQKNLAEVLQSYIERFPEKPILVYMDLQWCPGAKGDEQNIKALFEKVDDCNNIILLTTNVDKSYFKNQKIDTVLNVHDFFKYGLKKPEIKLLAKEINIVFGQKLPYYLFAPGNFNAFHNGKHLEFFNTFSKEEQIEKYYCK